MPMCRSPLGDPISSLVGSDRPSPSVATQVSAKVSQAGSGWSCARQTDATPRSPYIVMRTGQDLFVLLALRPLVNLMFSRPACGALAGHLIGDVAPRKRGG